MERTGRIAPFLIAGAAPVATIALHDLLGGAAAAGCAALGAAAATVAHRRFASTPAGSTVADVAPEPEVRTTIVLDDPRRQDPLTGLLTRIELERQLLLLSSDPLSPAPPLTVLVVGVDDPVTVGDTHGHSAGDDLVRQLGERLSTAIGAPEMNAPGAGDGTRVDPLLCRLDSAELLIVLPLDLSDAMLRADRLRAAAIAPYDLGGSRVRIGASVGLASIRAEDAPAAAIRHAAAALHRAQALGGGRVEIFDDHIENALVRRRSRDTALEEAFDAGELAVWYQPELELATAKVVGAEALARHPNWATLGLSTDELVVAALESGLVERLGQVISREVIEQIVAWQLLGLPATFRVRLNLSAAEIMQTDIATRITRLLDFHECSPRHLAVEVDEAGLSGSMTTMADRFGALREAGVRVGIDHFGTGQASMLLLRNLPVHEIRLDTTYIDDLPSNPSACRVVEGIVRTANELGVEVAADGVERLDQAAFLASVGCRRAQGFLWFAPVPAGTVEEQVLAPLRL